MSKKLLSALLVCIMVFSMAVVAGAEFNNGIHTGTGNGLMGEIEVAVTVAEGKITEIEVVTSSETADISTPAYEQITQQVIANQNLEVDMVSGATFTSKGFVEAIEDALDLKEDVKDTGIPFEKTDVIVIGAGMAGLSTAARAAQLGLNVLVLEQTGSVGGTAMVAGGTLLGAGTKMQAKANIEDDPELCFADFVRLGGAGTFNEEIARTFSEISGEAVDWLDDMGTDFGDREPYFGVYQPLNIARNYSGKGGASAFITALNGELEKHIDKKKVYISYNTTVTGLVTDEEGTVVGCNATLRDGTKAEYLAPATVICTGGYAGSEELLKKYNFDNVLTTAPAFVSGDGFKWLEELNAAFTNMDFCTAYAGGIPTSDDFRDFGYFAVQNGCLWIDINGNRMADEVGGDSKVKSDTWSDAEENIVYTVFSEEMILQDAKIFSTGPWGSVQEEFEPFMNQLIEKGLGWQGDTIEELAEKAGLPKEAFVATINSYNEGSAAGVDEFGRTQLTPMENGPFYAVKTVPYVMITSGGPMMNDMCEVYNTDGLVIEGVYIAGEIVGMANVGGLNSIGGMGHSNCLVWGKQAAEVISEKLK